MWQSLLDVIGKLGPLSVAVAVYLSNRRQTEWTNAVLQRGSALEDQRFRLALLDRRQIAIDAVVDANTAFFKDAGQSLSHIQKLRDALNTAELVFEAEERTAVAAVFQAVVFLMVKASARDAATEQEERAAANKVWGDAFLQVVRLIEPLPSRLRVAARVSQIPPVELRKPRRWPQLR